ncbi:MAG: CRISPR-associated protein Cas4 [Oscillospiraceae bacterium]
MSPQFNENDFLQISGLQHFVFCRRQWALIHVEHQWIENYNTVDGEVFHERAHDATLSEKRGDTLTTREMPIFSRVLGVSGKCDVVEFHRCEDGIPLQKQEGLWRIYPVEYKRGKPKEHNADELQLCCQAMCLEEMLAAVIPEGALFYGETRRRLTVLFTSELRETVRADLAEMHDLYARRHTPKVRPTKACGNCSLSEVCLSKLAKAPAVADYLRQRWEETL